MAYNSARDFITIDGMDFSDILDGDNAFNYSRSGDSMSHRVDSGGKMINFILTDNTITGSIAVRHDAKTALRKLRQLMNTHKSFTISRDNRNDGGEKVTFNNCFIINDGENGKSASGERDARTFNFISESKIDEEGAY